MIKVNYTGRIGLGCFALLALFMPSVWAQHPVEFTSTDPITINTPRFPGNDGRAVPMRATPYPSTINVSGFLANETIEKITITLHNLSHETPDDIDMMLVGPEGQNLVFFSDAGGGFVDPEVAVTVTLDDDADVWLPDNDAIVSGVFKPSNYEIGDDEEADVFPEAEAGGIPTPVPVPSAATQLAVFSGTSPNGEWRLYVVDDDVLDAGSIANGWSLTIRTGTQGPSLPFQRSDANADGAVSLTDAIVILYALFQGGPPPACADAADADDDGVVSLTDAVYTVSYLFVSGPAPPAPGPESCGVDPTEDELGCDMGSPCRSECPVGLENCNGVCTDRVFDNGNCGA